MTVFLYDHTFEGLLTALFDAYARKTFPEALLTAGEPLPCSATRYIPRDRSETSERVWKALRKNSPPPGLLPSPAAGSPNCPKPPCC